MQARYADLYSVHLGWLNQSLRTAGPARPIGGLQSPGRFLLTAGCEFNRYCGVNMWLRILRWLGIGVRVIPPAIAAVLSEAEFLLQYLREHPEVGTQATAVIDQIKSLLEPQNRGDT